MKRVLYPALGVLLAAHSMFAAAAMSGTGNLPPEKTQGKVIYLTGGIGADESRAIKQAESQFPLTLEFVKHAKPKAEYLADVHVLIKDQHGKTVLSTVADGPFLLAKLTPGKYVVHAQEQGRDKMEHLVIAANKPERVVFEWQ